MKRLFLLVALIAIGVASPSLLLAATLSISPSTGVYSAGATFTARVVVNTNGKAINAAEGTVKFNPNELLVVSVDRSSSIFNLWVTEPTYSNTAGTVSFSGGLPSGYTGTTGTVFSITFRTKAAGAPKVNLTGGSVLANDGMGTNVLTGMSGGAYTVQAISTTPEPEVVIEYVAPANTPGVPDITSSSHPAGVWSTNKTATLAWTLPEEVVAVRTLLNSSATAIPTKVYDTPIRSIELTELPEGVSYFHLQFKNKDGWGKVAHYRLAIDTEKPSEFVIAAAPGVEAANPEQTLALTVSDKTSGITRYMVRVDAAEAYEYTDTENTQKIILPPQSPGYHTVIIEAFDAAGNSVVGTHSFTIESFSKPVFTEYPTEISEEVIPVLRGSTRPEASVSVLVTKIGAESDAYTVTADEAGAFTFIPAARFQTGVYEITAEATDTYGARSLRSDPIRIAVQQPGYLRVGTFLVSVLSVIVPLVAMTILLLAFAWFMILYSRRFKRRLSRESGEVVMALERQFDALVAKVAEQKAVTIESRKSKKLTKQEEQTFIIFEEAIQRARAELAKEVQDVEQVLHKSNT